MGRKKLKKTKGKEAWKRVDEVNLLFLLSLACNKGPKRLPTILKPPLTK